MTHTPTPPPLPLGWHPAPDGSSAMWWWDGARWIQPQNEPSPAPTSAVAIARLAIATQVLLVISAVTSVVTIGIETFGINAASRYLGGDESAIRMIDSYDQLSSVFGILSSLSLLATGVLWMIWQYRVAKQFIGLTRRSPGWHVGSWILPVVNLWFPYQNIADLWRAVGRTRPSWQIVWWLLWVLSNTVSTQASRLTLNAQDLEQFQLAMSMSIVAETLLLAAAPLAWLTVRGITQGILHRSSAPVVLAPAV
ncbi:DUF4328 domain-containing protein [Leifsonia flava]|nr:DUF4328 domain-containing protein [Leifsonia flava]